MPDRRLPLDGVEEDAAPPPNIARIFPTPFTGSLFASVVAATGVDVDGVVPTGAHFFAGVTVDVVEGDGDVAVVVAVGVGFTTTFAGVVVVDEDVPVTSAFIRAATPVADDVGARYGAFAATLVVAVDVGDDDGSYTSVMSRSSS
jgi:hypothetical protein